MSATTGLSASHSAELEQLFNQHLNAPQVENVTVDNAKSQFKKIWPEVKQGLDLLKQLAGIVPGVGPFVTIGAGAIVAAGDAAYKALGGT